MARPEREKPRIESPSPGEFEVVDVPPAQPRTHPAQPSGFEVIHLDRAVGAIAEAQKGLVRHDQLLHAGLHRGAIAHWLRSGRLIRRHRGVYALAHAALPPFATEMASVLALGLEAVSSRTSACVLWDIWLPPRHRPAPGQAEVTVPGRRRASRPGLTVHSTTRLDAPDRTRRHGVPVTSVARTLIDLTCVLRRDRDLERAVDSAVSGRLVNRAGLELAMGRVADPRQTARLRMLIADRRPGQSHTRSGLEEAVLALCRRSDLPDPVLNSKVGRFEVDFFWPEQQVALEIDGYAFHSTRARLERDRPQEAYLRANNIELLRYSEDQFREAREAIAVAVTKALCAGGGF